MNHYLATHPVWNPAVETRIGDAERESAVSALGEHFVAGRLTKDEYDERSERAWSARTHAQLAPLFADLPGLPPHARAGGGPRSRRGAFRPFPMLVLLVVLAAVTPMPWFVVLIFAVVWWSGLLNAGQGKPRGQCFR